MISIKSHLTLFHLMNDMASLLFLMLILVNEFVRGDIAILDRHNKSIELLIDYKITYTPTIPDEGLFGALIIAEPPDACIPIKSAPNSSINWFVLAYRSSFKLRARIAKKFSMLLRLVSKR
ncbi:hypothetical protein SSS_02603 [Sarcoptes scabiei]|nr:hypothetical protein SSS_02603 [Sarcoptes scabiei]